MPGDRARLSRFDNAKVTDDRQFAYHVMGRAALLLLADGRLPAGGHAHSGSLEPAVADGSVRDIDDLAGFLAGRLSTSGLVAASFAAAACHRVVPDFDAVPDLGAVQDLDAVLDLDGLLELDAELEARTPSPAQRAASRAQGRALMRAGRAAWPALVALPAVPHHPVAVGIVTAAAGGGPGDAAALAAYGCVTGPASAATRLLGLDPLAVTGLLARLATEVDRVAAHATTYAASPARALPAIGAVRLDLLAQAHRAAAMRLFAS